MGLSSVIWYGIILAMNLLSSVGIDSRDISTVELYLNSAPAATMEMSGTYSQADLLLEGKTAVSFEQSRKYSQVYLLYPRFDISVEGASADATESVERHSVQASDASDMDNGESSMYASGDMAPIAIDLTSALSDVMLPGYGETAVFSDTSYGSGEWTAIMGSSRLSLSNPSLGILIIVTF